MAPSQSRLLHQLERRQSIQRERTTIRRRTVPCEQGSRLWESAVSSLVKAPDYHYKQDSEKAPTPSVWSVRENISVVS